MPIDLPILNYAFAVNQLGGNEVLLRKTLGKFVSEFEETSAEVTDLIDNNDLKAAKMKVHTVKGISGNLGLQALFDCTSKFDAELRSGEYSQETLQQFTLLVSQTCLEIKQMENAEDSEYQFREPTLPPEKSKIDLIKRLKKSEFIDDQKLMSLISGLGLLENDAKNLLQLIEDLQYHQAIELIEQNT